MLWLHGGAGQQLRRGARLSFEGSARFRRPRLSVIIPVLDEAAALGRRQCELRNLRKAVHELIVVDGGSRDDSLEVSRSFSTTSLVTGAGRARQMNEGARRASGDILLFLHADTRIPEGGAALVGEAMAKKEAVWGRFDVRLSGSHPLFRVVETAMNWRSRLSGIATGDQGIFVRRSVFERLGGFPPIPLMEDVELSRTLRRIRPPICLREPVVTSSRRWQRDGILKTVLLMWSLRLAYSLGVNPARLHRIYYRS